MYKFLVFNEDISSMNNYLNTDEYNCNYKNNPNEQIPNSKNSRLVTGFLEEEYLNSFNSTEIAKNLIYGLEHYSKNRNLDKKFYFCVYLKACNYLAIDKFGPGDNIVKGLQTYLHGKNFDNEDGLVKRLKDQLTDVIPMVKGYFLNNHNITNLEGSAIYDIYDCHNSYRTIADRVSYDLRKNNPLGVNSNSLGINSIVTPNNLGVNYFFLNGTEENKKINLANVMNENIFNTRVNNVEPTNDPKKIEQFYEDLYIIKKIISDSGQQEYYDNGVSFIRIETSIKFYFASMDVLKPIKSDLIKEGMLFIEGCSEAISRIYEEEDTINTIENNIIENKGIN